MIFGGELRDAREMFCNYQGKVMTVKSVRTSFKFGH